jgi:hypothetical protein
VAPRPGGRLNNALVFSIVALAIGAVGLLYLVQTSRVASLGYQVSALQREREARLLRNQQLSYDVARYQSLVLVERVAREQLGMVPMEDYVFFTVARPVVDELPAPATPVPARPSLAERVWDRITGVGTATDTGPEAP